MSKASYQRTTISLLFEIWDPNNNHPNLCLLIARLQVQHLNDFCKSFFLKHFLSNTIGINSNELNLFFMGYLCSSILNISRGIWLFFLFSWILPFFKYGYKNDLKIKDIYNTTDRDLSGPLGDALERYYYIF